MLDDPEDWHDTAIVAEVDLAASDDAGSPVWRTLNIARGPSRPTHAGYGALFSARVASSARPSRAAGLELEVRALLRPGELFPGGAEEGEGGDHLHDPGNDREIDADTRAVAETGEAGVAARQCDPPENDDQGPSAAAPSTTTAGVTGILAKLTSDRSSAR